MEARTAPFPTAIRTSGRTTATGPAALAELVGHFVHAHPARAHLLLVSPAPARFVPAPVDFARTVSLPADSGQRERAGAFSLPEPAPENPAQSARRHPVRIAPVRIARARQAVRPRPELEQIAENPAPGTRPGIAGTRRQTTARWFLSEVGRLVGTQQPRLDVSLAEPLGGPTRRVRAPTALERRRSIELSATPECRRPIQLLAPVDDCRAVAPIRRPATP